MVTQTGDRGLWGAFRGTDGSFVAIAGRLAFDEREWSAQRPPGVGGQAAAIVYRHYLADGPSALEGLNGNFAVVVFDATRRRLHLATDYCGMLPAFEADSPAGWVAASHPDVLADAAGERGRLDEVSLAEFVLARTVTPPHTYYERIRAAEIGTVYSLNLDGARPLRPAAKRYFDFAYRGEPRATEDELAEDLAGALQRAVHRRSLPRLGATAVALSGGLDSRVILASLADSRESFAFTVFDEPNRELRTAEAIARALGARFLPIARAFDYYADSALAGVAISGGMGSLANNHFLGLLPRLAGEGMRTMLTGCYCDYLFKALPLNRRVHPLTGRESLGPFRHEFYFSRSAASTPLAARARERSDARIPQAWRGLDQVETIFRVEAQRTFPLCYEGDNQQRLVPQRLTGWSPPLVDREVLEIYRRVPYHYKLNRSLFKKVVEQMVPGLRAIPNANTGAPPGTSQAWEAFRSSLQRMERLWRRAVGAPSQEESWPDWAHYVNRSARVRELWTPMNAEASDLFARVLGPASLPSAPGALTRGQTYPFIGLLTLKLWFDSRRGVVPRPPDSR